MTDKKQQIQSILNLMKSLNISIDDLRGGDRDFLTYEEAKEKADDVHWYEKGVYKYEIDTKFILIENGVKLIENVDYVWWYEKGVYDYEIDDKLYEINLKEGE